MGDDWDLSAFLKSCSSRAPHEGMVRQEMENKFFAPDDDFTFGVPQSPLPFLMDTRNDPLDDPFYELSSVYKPFYGSAQPTATPVTADPAIGGSGSKGKEQEVQQLNNAIAPGVNAPVTGINDATQLEASQHPLLNQNDGVGSQRPRRTRRGKQPRLAMKVDEEGLLSHDPWNWRKYGQKQIAGFSVPRSYYRCTSYKGCTARKQVSRCPEEPGMYAVNFFGEHTHRRGGRRLHLNRRKVVSSSTTSGGDPLKEDYQNSEPSDKADHEAADEEDNDDDDDDDDDDIFIMALHEFVSGGSASTSGEHQPSSKNSIKSNPRGSA